MKLTREQHKGIIEHDYHQMAFSRDTYLDELMRNQKLWELLDKEDPNAYVLVKSILKESKK